MSANALSIAATGLAAQQRLQEAAAHNIANFSSTRPARVRVSVREAAAPPPAGAGGVRAELRAELPADEAAAGLEVDGEPVRPAIDPALEHTASVLAQRAFQANLRVVQAADQVLGSLLDRRR